MRASTALLVISLAVGATACGGISEPGTNTNTDFTATLDPLGGNVHTFSAGRLGEYSISIVSTSPDAGAQLRVYLGLDVGGLCNALSATYIMKAGQTTPTGSIQKTAYCVQIDDPARPPASSTTPGLTRSETYTIRVSHP